MMIYCDLNYSQPRALKSFKESLAVSSNVRKLTPNNRCSLSGTYRM